MSTRHLCPLPRRFATIAATCMTACVVASCGGDGDDQAPPTPPPRTVATTPPAPPLSAPGRVARQYAIASRTWTPSTYRAQYRKQLRLTTGPLREAVLLSRPRTEQIAAYRADRASASADVTDVQRVSETTRRARYRVTLNETTVAGGQTVRQHSTYVAELEHRDGRWLVSTFTVEP